MKEFEGDGRSIILKLHHYHTKSNVAQHDIIIRSAVRSATKTSRNLRLDPPKGEDQPQDFTANEIHPKYALKKYRVQIACTLNKIYSPYRGHI